MQGTVLRARRRAVLLVGAMVAALTGLGFVVPTAASAATGCEVEYQVENEWPGGFTADVTVTNLGDAVDGWDLAWRFPSGQRVTQAWNAEVGTSDDQVTAMNLSYNARIASDASTTFGFVGTWSGANEAPTEFRLNGLVCTGAAEEPTTPPPGGDASATEIVDAMQPGFNLGNNLDAVGADETAWGYPRITPEFLQSIRDYGFNSVRIPVTWDYHQEKTGDYAVEEAWLDRVEEVVNYALDEDLYVLVNVHHDSWIWMADMQSDHEEVLARYEALWTAIAERFRDYPDTVLFESVNEPQFNDVDDATAYGLLDELNRSFHRIVRDSGGANADRVLVLPTLYTNDEQARLDALNATFDAIDDPNVAATIHFYGFWPFSVNIAGYTTFNDEVRRHIIDAYDRTHDAFVARGIPVIIGEWSLLGYQPGGKVEQGETLKFLEYAYWYAEERDLTVMLWDVAPHFDRWDFAWRDQELWEMFQASWTSRSGTASSDQVFVERASAVTDATLTLNLNGLDFEGLREGDTSLVEGEDYTVSGDQLTIEAATLERIVAAGGYGEQTDLYADFSQGVPWRISVIAYDEPSAADAAGTTDSFAIPTRFNGDQLATMESVYDDGTAAGPTNWTPYQEYGSAFQPEYEDGTIVMPPAFFDAVEDDRPVTLTFHFWSGETVAYQVVESGDAVTGTAI
ncbi:cellulase family glycosylhydrolase [Glycomyces arizonensis]|uniref:cellulase family glycosylhydrolase n=1 Tax=Glycomyces arizonensis TaxID=256035 RepID=UPI0004249E16|nr:cellulase family glycosylhydrolase [Glycomyces arizonensis]